MNDTTAALLLLLAVLCVAAVSTRLVAVLASLVAFVVFNFFFLDPIHTFSIARPDDMLALFSLLAVSLIGSHLSQQARRSAEMKSAMVASFSHDLKTPLTALAVAAGNVGAAGLSDDERGEQIAIVQSEIERLKKLFDNLMAMASVEARAIQADVEWVHPADIVEAASMQLRPLLDGRSVAVHAGDASDVVRIDPRLTSASLAHVLENAAAYSPAGSPISIDVRADADQLRIAVRDHGPGVPDAELARVFDRFFRGSSGSANRFSSGMGLAIARGLVDVQGGRITVANHPDGGAIFTLIVPAPTRHVDELAQVSA
jgi:two-component system sensor histidine kinase KdpD